MPNPRMAAEWAVFLEDWATLPSGVSPQMMAEMVCVFARQQVERYALTVDDPASMHLHYDGCPFKPYADKFDVDIPEPRPECTCAEAHKAAYWKGQWSLEQAAGHLKARQEVAVALERAAQIVDQWACSTTCDSTGAPCEHIRVAVTMAAAIRALPL